jgi:hypothetical protein
MWEKRLVTADRRPSSAEGSSWVTSSDIGETEGDSGDCEGFGGLGSSAYCRTWDRTLH